MNPDVHHLGNVGPFRQDATHCLRAQVGIGRTRVDQEEHVSKMLWSMAGQPAHQVDHEAMVDSVEHPNCRPGSFRKRLGITQIWFSMTANICHYIGVQHITGDIGEEHVLLIWCNVTRWVDDGVFVWRGRSVGCLASLQSVLHVVVVFVVVVVAVIVVGCVVVFASFCVERKLAMKI